jgi:hypothetical protein
MSLDSGGFLSRGRFAPFGEVPAERNCLARDPEVWREGKVLYSTNEELRSLCRISFSGFFSSKHAFEKLFECLDIMEEETLSPEQQMDLACQLAQQAFAGQTLQLETQLAEVRQALRDQERTLLSQSERKNELSKQSFSLMKAYQDLKARNQDLGRDIEDLQSQKQKLLEFKASLIQTVHSEDSRLSESTGNGKPWESYLTDSGRKPDVFSVTRELKTKLSYESYKRLTLELMRMSKGEQSKTETLAKMRVLLRGHEDSFSVLQTVVLEGS